MQERQIIVTNRLTMPHRELARLTFDRPPFPPAYAQLLVQLRQCYGNDVEIVETNRIIHQPA